VVPRVPTLDVVAEPLRALGVPADEAQDRAKALLTQLNIPERLWSLSPTTFSGGEQQRVNIARGFAHTYPAMLLDEPTATLDQTLEAAIVSRLGPWLEGRTAIIATHRVPILQLTSRVTILQAGRLSVDGPRDQVLAHLARGGAAPVMAVQGGQG